MQFIFSKKEAKPMARSLEKFFKRKGIVLEHGTALDALSVMQGFTDWNALSAIIEPDEKMTLQQTVTLYVRVSVQDESGEGPEWAKILIDEPFMAKLKKMRDAVIALRVVSMTDWADPERWGPWAANSIFEEYSGLSEAQLEVSKDGFWYSAPVKHGDYFVETALVSFDLLAEALAANESRDTSTYSRRGNSIVFALEEKTAIRGARTDFIEALLEAEEPVESFLTQR